MDDFQPLISYGALDTAYDENYNAINSSSWILSQLIHNSSFNKQLLSLCQAKFHWHKLGMRDKFPSMIPLCRCEKEIEADGFSSLVVAGGQITPDTVQACVEEGFSLLHLAFCYFGDYCQASENNDAGTKAWLHLIGTVVTLYDGDLHFRNDLLLHNWESYPAGGVLPLTLFLYGTVLKDPLIWNYPPMLRTLREYTSQVQSHLRRLVAELKRINPNINLVSLGEELAKEVAVIIRDIRCGNAVGPTRSRPVLSIGLEYQHIPSGEQFWSIANIFYGPEPEDWSIQWEYLIEPEMLVGDFWYLVEPPPPPTIPGAWPDEDD